MAKKIRGGSAGKKWHKQGSNAEEEKKSEADYIKKKEAEWKLISSGKCLCSVHACMHESYNIIEIYRDYMTCTCILHLIPIVMIP